MACLVFLDRQVDGVRVQEICAHSEQCVACRTLLHALERESRLLTSAMLEEDERPLAAAVGTSRIWQVGNESRTNNEEETMNLYGPKQLADSMRTVRKNTIIIAEDIPEKDYGYRPTPESRSVAELLVHIASLSRADHLLHEEMHVSSLEGFDFGQLIKNSETEEKRPHSKSEVVALLLREGDRWCQWVEGLSVALLSEKVRMPGGSSKSRFEMLLGTKEHEMHHRAQLTVMERLLGIVPHLTRNRQAAGERVKSAS